MTTNTLPFSINQATTKSQWNMRQAIEGYRRHGIDGIATWRDKLAECGIKETVKLLADNGMKATGHYRAGMYPGATKAERQAAIDENKRAIDETAAIKATCLVLLGGAIPKGHDVASARSMFMEGLAEVLPYARAAGVPMAIEPMHPMYAGDRGCVSTLCQANDICDQLGEGTAVAVDTYHTWWDPALEREIARAGKVPGRLISFHICDWLVPTTDFLLDRGMMGDGCVNIPLIRDWMRKAGYNDYVEVEIFSNRWWREDPDVVVETCLERYRTVC